MDFLTRKTHVLGGSGLVCQWMPDKQLLKYDVMYKSNNYILSHVQKKWWVPQLSLNRRSTWYQHSMFSDTCPRVKQAQGPLPKYVLIPKVQGGTPPWTNALQPVLRTSLTEILFKLGQLLMKHLRREHGYSTTVGLPVEKTTRNPPKLSLRSG